MSHVRRAASSVALCLGIALAGCCGSGPSHKCDFTPPGQPGVDAGSDGPLPCGTQICELPQVCCIKKVPLVALCIDAVNFEANGCEKLDLQCIVPAECPSGLVCCVQLAPVAGITCLPQQICPGDGTSTYHACDSDADCPRLGSSCQIIGTADNGVDVLKVCTP